MRISCYTRTMRTRFAPSPTGSLHIGGLRTALFAWLVAKQNKGTFFLRIEDTDKVREAAGSIENIVSTLAWSGLTPDEGVTIDENGEIVEKGVHGPYFQSKRLDLYKKYADQLLAKGHAYHCFCTSERLEQMRKYQTEHKQPPMYDRTCCALTKEEAAERVEKGEKYVIRMKVPRSEKIEFYDEIYGKLSFMGHTVDDQVLMKSDGFPTYHLAHVVDDHLMKTDMVIRGEEWLSSLPKHLLLFKFLDLAPPKYAHMPLLLNKDRTKLSKRQNDVSAESYQHKGYLPEVVINFLALLGWNPGTTQELFTLTELIDTFSLERVQKAGAVFDIEKLDWLQGQWMRKMPSEEFASRIKPIVAQQFPAANDDQLFEQRAGLMQERITFFSEAPSMMSFYYEEPAPSMDIVVSAKQKVTQELLPTIMKLLIDTLEAIDESKWTMETLSSELFAAIEKAELKKGQVLWPLRAILTGREYSPGAFEVATLLGKEKTIERLHRFQ